jgi:hypothetical protein
VLNRVLLGYSLEHGVADLNSRGDGELEGRPDNGVIYGDEGERYSRVQLGKSTRAKKEGIWKPSMFVMGTLERASSLRPPAMHPGASAQQRVVGWG